MDDNYIETQLQKFNVTDAAIFELESKYSGLTIADVNDTDGYKAVKAARIVMKNYRVDIDKRRKELTEDALKYQRAINAEAKRITSLLTPLEDQLAEKEKSYDDEVLRLKKLKEQEDAAKLQGRINALLQCGMMFNGTHYVANYMGGGVIEIEAALLKTVSDSVFEEKLIDIKDAHKCHLENLATAKKFEEEKRAREDADRKAEQDRLTQQRREQEIENERLADIAREQAKQAAALKAESDRIEAEKNKLIISKESEMIVIPINPENIRPTLVIPQDSIKHEAVPSIKYETAPVVHRDITIDANTIYDCILRHEHLVNRNITFDEVEEILVSIHEFIDVAIMDFVLQKIEGMTCEQE